MKNFLSVLVLLTALLVSGFGGKSTMGISTAENLDTVTITAENSRDGGGSGYLKINDGETILVASNITSGKLLLKIKEQKGDRSSIDPIALAEDKNFADDVPTHVIDKSGKSFIDVPAGDYLILIDSEGGLTGEIILSAAPKN